MAEKKSYFDQQKLLKRPMVDGAEDARFQLSTNQPVVIRASTNCGISRRLGYRRLKFVLCWECTKPSLRPGLDANGSRGLEIDEN